MELTASVEIARPAAEVFDYIADPANNPNWQKGMRKCAWITEPPVAVGSRYHQEAAFLGRGVSSIFEVTDYVPGESVSFKTVQSTFPIEVTRSVEDLGDDISRVTAVIGGGPRVPRFLRGIVQRIAQRSVSRDYARLVELLS